jgi:glycosyltransferase involved in cell wall biosynthesis
MKIALGLEYSLALRGGVSVLVEKLIEGISSVHEVVLVSPDQVGFQHPGVHSHLCWDPASVSRETSEHLATRLSELGVSLAHFHFGGNYGWGIRIPGQSPFSFLHKKGIAAVSTSHMAVSILDGYCAQTKPLWFKLGLLPLGWSGKLDQLRNVRAEVAVSQGVCKRLQRWYWPMRSKFRSVYHSRLPASPDVRANKPREPLVLCVGHIALRKGQHTLATAFAKIAAAHPAWKLALLGHPGPDDCFKQVQATIAAHNLQDRILLLGSRDDTMEFMRRSSVFVQPALFEGLPLALQEAMFCGCACVATRVIGNDELISDGKNGLLVPPVDSNALALALERLMGDEYQRTVFGEAAAESIRLKGMNGQTMTERHLHLYQSILQGTGPGREREPIAIGRQPPVKQAKVFGS